MKPRYLLLLLLLVGSLAGNAQRASTERYNLPRRLMPLEKALIKLTQAGAPLSYRPDQLPQLAVQVPGGRRTLDRWLEYLLRDTELTYQVGAAGYLILPDPDLLNHTFHLFGTVTDGLTGERLIGAAVQLPERQSGTLTNEYGFFTTPSKGGRQRLRITYIGYSPRDIDLVLRSDTLLHIRLRPNRELPQVVVTAIGRGAEGGTGNYTETGTRIGQAEVAQMGGPGGEADPLRLARLLPGVTSGADGVGGVFIRGSEAGHNLVLLDGVPVYNLNHAAGLFSIFNNQAIRRIDLYKDALPARFGGRIGGVLDVSTRDGNLYDHELTIGSSLLSTQVAAEGPITRGESSFLLTGRYFWAGALLREFSERYKANRGRVGRMDYNVHDLNFKLNQRAGSRGRIYLSLYSGEDDYANRGWRSPTSVVTNEAGATFETSFPELQQEQLRWGNTVGALRYNYIFNDHLFGNFRLSYSDMRTTHAFEQYDSIHYTNEKLEDDGEILSGRYASEIKQLGLAFDGQYTTNSGAKLRFGAEVNDYRFLPLLSIGEVPLEQHETLESVDDEIEHRPFQMAAYASFDSRWRKLYYRIGLRGNFWRDESVNHYNFSPRILLAGPLNPRLDWQLSYDRTVQPVHLLNSAIIGLPSDLWVPSTDDIKPATSQQISGKLTARPAENWKFETAIYYKTMRNLVAYEEGLQNERRWARNLSQGTGRAYGLETSLHRSRGKLRGWVSYALARTDRRFDSRINQGNRFPFRYDRRHNVNAVFIYQLGLGTTLTATWRYGSGAAYSLSEEVADLSGVGDENPLLVALVDTKNGFRLPANHRLDINLHTTLQAENSTAEHSFNLGLYNVYNRRNPIYYELRDELVNGGPERELQPYQIFVAPLLPSLSYQLRFGTRSGKQLGK